MDSRFSKGDNVIIESTGKIGTINNVIKRNGDFGYKVTIDGKVFTYQEKFLKKYINEEENIISEWDEGKFGDAKQFKIFQTWYRLKRPIEGNLYSFLASKTLFNQFQFKPLLKFISQGSEQRLFIADEVGVGKTIETGIILTELVARGQLTRKNPILIVCPNSLGPKWAKEMKNRFNFDFHVHSAESLYSYLKEIENNGKPLSNIWSVTSVQTLRHKKYLSLVEKIKSARIEPIWQMLIIDEAHHFRNLGTETNNLGHLLSDMSEMMIMLSATPLNLKNTDFFNQMNILNPNIYPDKQTFEALIEPVKSLNRCRKLLVSKDGQYNEILKELDEIKKTTLGELIYNQPIISEMIGNISKGIYLTDEKIALYEKVLISMSPLDQSFTRTLKREAMNHRVIRETMKVAVELNELEREFYDEIIEVIKDFYIAKGGNLAALGFITNVPRRMASSCIPALKDYLAWCIDNNFMEVSRGELEECDEDENSFEKIELSGEFKEKFKSLYQKAEKINLDDSKYKYFSDLIKQLFSALENKQVIVFSFFIRTLKYLKIKLEAEGYKVGLISGDIPVVSKGNELSRYDIMEQFERGEIDILLSSDVGGEGLDFQFCQAMINYDLPYNPMKIEQRIGRVDRFGQKADKVIIASMYIKDTVDESIYNALYGRIKLVEDNVGLIEPIINQKITNLQNEIITKSLNDKQLEKRIEEINLAIEQGKIEMQNFERNRQDLLGDEYFNKSILNMQKTDFVTPEDAMFLSEFYLKQYDGCNFKKIDEEIALISLSKEVQKKIEIFMRKPKSDGSNNELYIFTNKKKVKLTFNGNVAVNNQELHFISPCGFWTRFILEELEEMGEFKKIFSVKMKDVNDFQKGNYIIPLFEVKIEGFKTELNLAAVPININNKEILNYDYIKLARQISNEIEGFSDVSLEVDLEDFIDIGTEAVDNQIEDKIEDLKKDTKFKIESKKRSIREGSNVRCERLKKKISTHIEKSNEENKEISHDFIRLMEAQIANEKESLNLKIQKIEDKSDISVNTVLIGVIYINN